MFDFQLRRAAPHDFATVIRLIQALLGEMYTLNSAAMFDQGEAWRDFEVRLWRSLQSKEHAEDAEPCAAGRLSAEHLLELADTSSQAALTIGVIEASVLCPVPIFRLARTLHIHAVYVLPGYRCRGVGTALLQSALAWGRQNRCQQAQLSVLPHNPARRLYQALGFTVDGVMLRQDLTCLPT